MSNLPFGGMSFHLQFWMEMASTLTIKSTCLYVISTYFSSLAFISITYKGSTIYCAWILDRFQPWMNWFWNGDWYLQVKRTHLGITLLFNQSLNYWITTKTFRRKNQTESAQQWFALVKDLSCLQLHHQFAELEIVVQHQS